MVKEKKELTEEQKKKLAEKRARKLEKQRLRKEKREKENLSPNTKYAILIKDGNGIFFTFSFNCSKPRFNSPTQIYFCTVIEYV